MALQPCSPLANLLCRHQLALAALCLSRRACSDDARVHFDADADTLREVLGRNVAPIDRKDQAILPLTTRREALSLYRDILRKSRVFTWESKPGETWRETLCNSARTEFEQHRHEANPQRVTTLLLAGRDAVQQTLDKLAQKRDVLLRPPPLSRT